MKRALFFALGIALLAIAPAAAVAQTTANGPYYAWPAWDQTLPCTSTAACPRFVVLSNMASAAVLDRDTGLVWERAPGTGASTWALALQICTGRVVAHRFGWRLPTAQELYSLLDQSSPTLLPPGHPFTVPEARYWSASTVAALTGNAYGVSLAPPFPFTFHASKSESFGAWCVRGGQGVDPQ